MHVGDKMIIYVKMDIFESPAQVLVNTVNTVGVMGKGIAKQYKKLYPEMFKEYQMFCEKGLLDIGKLWIYKTDKKWILNFPTKKHWRNKSKIEYIEKGLEKFVSTYKEKGIRSISFPPLGCGNGGLDWENEVKPLMEKYLTKLDIDVFIHVPLEKFKLEKQEYKSVKEVKKWLNSEPNYLSIFEVWEDLTEIDSNKRSIQVDNKKYTFEFMHSNDLDEDVIVFKNLEHEDNPVYIAKQDISAVWNILRDTGVLSAKLLPGHLDSNRKFVFELLEKLSYVEYVTFLTSLDGKEQDEIGVRLLPSNDSNFSQGEIEL